MSAPSLADLKKRVEQFNALELPGQPMGMHMGTSYLVGDLMREIERLRAINADLLEALRPFADLGVGPGPDYEVDAASYRILRGAIRNARAAIARAEAIL